MLSSGNDDERVSKYCSSETSNWFSVELISLEQNFSICHTTDYNIIFVSPRDMIPFALGYSQINCIFGYRRLIGINADGNLINFWRMK